MKLGYALRDENNQGGQQVSLRQGEIKTLQIFWFDANGCPYAFPAISELEVHISQVNSPALVKKLSLSQCSLLTSTELSGKIGVSLPLSATDTNLPVSSTLGMSIVVKNSTSVLEELDLPNALNVSAPLVV